MDKKYNDTTIKHILALIRWGANGYNELFKDEADEIAKELDSEGYHYQANFIKAQFGEIPTFEPMETPNAEETKSKTSEMKRVFDERGGMGRSERTPSSIGGSTFTIANSNGQRRTRTEWRELTTGDIM